MNLEEQEGIENFQNVLSAAPENWDVRSQLATLLFNTQEYVQAGDVVWQAPEIPTTVEAISFAVRILAPGHPRRSLRLLTIALESTKHKPANLMALAEALMGQGMALEASRVYGAATSADSGLADEDFEAWLLWIDHNQKLWGDFVNADIKLGEVPWLGIDPGREIRVGNAAAEELEGVLMDDVNAPSASNEQALKPELGKVPSSPPGFVSKSQPEEPAEVSPATATAVVPTKKEELGGATPLREPSAIPLPPSTPPPPSVPSAPAAMVPPAAISPPSSLGEDPAGSVAPPPTMPNQVPVASSPTPMGSMLPPRSAPSSPPPSISPVGKDPTKKPKLAFPKASDALRVSQKIDSNTDQG